MSNLRAIGRLLAVTSLVTAALAACNNNNSASSPPPPPPPPPNQTVDFSTFAQQAFAQSANSTPVSLDSVTFTYDVNDNTTAFDSLIMSGSI